MISAQKQSNHDAFPIPFAGLSGNQNSSLVLLSLRRSSLELSWGLSLSLLPCGMIVVGGVGATAAAIPITGSSSGAEVPQIRGSWSVPMAPNQVSISPQQLLGTVSLHQMIEQSRSNQAISGFLPGDIILAVNGRMRFDSLHGLSSYLRSCYDLIVWIYRHPPALFAAFRFKDDAYQAAMAAYQVVSAAQTTKFSDESQQSQQKYQPLPVVVSPCTPPSSVASSGGHNHAMSSTAPLKLFATRKRKREESRCHLFLNPAIQQNFQTWMQDRKDKWRKRYQVYQLTDAGIDRERSGIHHRRDTNQDVITVAKDFWTRQGYSSFHDWLHRSVQRWKQSYGWNQQKRQRLELDSQEVIHLDDNFAEWLRVRKNQWKILRRKRHRQRLHEEMTESRESSELDMIDAILEEEERRMRKKGEAVSPPLDLQAGFDVDAGCPDDVLAHIFRFLHPLEHFKLLTVSTRLRKSLLVRDTFWQRLCPSRWILPRRPRKPWHEIYRTMLQAETEKSRKRWDDLLVRITGILWKGDHLQSIERLVERAEEGFAFDINYTSGGEFCTINTFSVSGG